MKLKADGKALMKIWNRQSKLEKAVNLLGFLIILLGIGVSIFMNCVGRTLWLDEAMLAFSFSKRSFLGLTSGVFEWDQSAPVLYLYLVKLLTMLFGNTEFVLRSFSILAYIAVLFLSAYVAKKLFRIKYPVLVAAFLANMNFILKYSNEFKQYLSECIWVLLVLVLYYFHKEKKLAWWKMMLGFMVFIWGANPACFFIGGVLLYEFFSGVFTKNKTLVRNSVLTGVGVGVSFIVYYVYWLRGIALSGSMQSYWENASFPLIPKSIDDLKTAQAMVYEIFITFREARIFMVAFVLAAFIIGIVFAKNRYCAVILLGFSVTLFASYIHMFPVADRLWCFSFPIFTILAFYAIDQMAVSSRRAEIVAVFLMFTLMLTNNGILVYRHAENVYQKGEEANPCIAYLENHVTEGEKVYVYYQSIPVTKYKIGYETERIGNVETDNIIWATDTLDREDAQPDIEKVLKEDKCYILASHAPAERIEPLLNAAKEAGNLEIVMNEYETPLYYYTREPEDMKGRVSYKLISQEEEGDTCYVTIRVQNTGGAYINTEFDDVKVGCREREDIGTNLWGNLAPGAYFDMPMQFDWNGDAEVSLQLHNGGKYWYDELGVAPIAITKGNVTE
ncbi:MAG: glycosyltransferase family 39 protein [Lachnospiraceae bacterium]|nr:glycosyltransferase family 39 protein [Lachnospiraceae bacterium]